MTRTERIPQSQSLCRQSPLINSDQLDQYYPESEDSRPAFRSAFNDASFHKGTAHFQPCPLSRKSLERAIQQISAAELPAASTLSGIFKISIGATARRLRSDRRQQRSVFSWCFSTTRHRQAGGYPAAAHRAFIECEQDRGLKVASVRQKLQNVYAFMRYLSRRIVWFQNCCCVRSI